MKYNASVPAKLDYFYPFGVYGDVRTIIESGEFFPTYITGNTSNGKTTAVEQACAELGRTYIRINMTQQADEETIIGTKTLKDGNVVVEHGPVLIAMLTGSILLIDEIDAANPNLIMALQAILEGKKYYFKLNDTWVHPAKGFNIFVTANTKGKGSTDRDWVGTNILNEAFLERFAVTLEQDYPNEEAETEILKSFLKSQNVTGKEDLIKTLITWSSTIRKTCEAEGTQDIITTRRLIHILRAYLIFGDEKQAVRKCLNRFTKNIKLSYFDLFDKLSVGKLVST